MTTIANPPVRRVEMMETSPPRWTYHDFMRLAPEDQKAELIDGALIVMPPPLFAHERLQIFLIKVIGMFVDFFNLGQVLGSRTAVRISLHQVYEPDILFVTNERRYIIAESEVLEAPDLVIEILSGSTAQYDRGVKRENYEKAGVRELWLIDPYGPAGTQFYQRQGDVFVEVAAANGILYSTVLPNFKLNTAWLWPDEQGNLPNPIAVLKELGVSI
jgi:Uma2 family endonuclease